MGKENSALLESISKLSDERLVYHRLRSIYDDLKVLLKKADQENDSIFQQYHLNKTHMPYISYATNFGLEDDRGIEKILDNLQCLIGTPFFNEIKQQLIFSLDVLQNELLRKQQKNKDLKEFVWTLQHNKPKII